jgi:hypothetical protein
MREDADAGGHSLSDPGKLPIDAPTACRYRAGMTTIDTTRRTGLRARSHARDYGRHAALGFAIACVLTACTFGDDQVLTAKTGVAASLSDCVPRECYLGCCSGTGFDWDPQLVGGKGFVAACSKLMKNATYAQYSDLMQLDINDCSSEYSFEWGNCVPIPPEDVVKLTPDGGIAPSGLHFNECPPNGDWIAYPIDEDEIDLMPQEQP